MKIQDAMKSVANTLTTLNIKSDYETMNKLLGCINLLNNLAEAVENAQQQQQKEET